MKIRSRFAALAVLLVLLMGLAACVTRSRAPRAAGGENTAAGPAASAAEEKADAFREHPFPAAAADVTATTGHPADASPYGIAPA